jgi:ATP-dependent Clp protease ATP-binding subunit ClpA
MEKQLLSFIENDSLKKKTNKQKCEEMLDEFISIRNEWIKETSASNLKIEEKNILEIFSKITGLDKEKIKSEDTKSFLNFKEDLKSKVFDQEEAIDSVYNTLLCAKAGIRKRKKTIANLLFVGSTGIGKTYMAKVIAENYFNKSNCFLQIDMAEYVDKNSISKLIVLSDIFIVFLIVSPDVL